MSAKLLIGTDIGTTGAKSVLIDDFGNILGSELVEYSLNLPQPGWAEQDPEDWVQATVTCLRNLLAKACPEPSALAGLSFSGQMHGLVCLDANHKVLRPAILWCDTRTTAQCRRIEQSVGGRARLIELAANPALEGFTLPKLIWVKENEPAVFSQIRTILLPKDYVRFVLTGELGMDLSDAAGTLLLDVRKRRWSPEIIAAFGLDPDMLPRLGESSEVAGKITASMAAETHLPEGLPVAFGGADNACAAVGNGVIEEGTVAVSIGTSGTVIAPTSSPLLDPEGRVHTFNHSVPGLWYVMGVMQAAGLSLKWIRDNFGGEERAKAVKTGRDAYEFLAADVDKVEAGAEGLLWLPYLNGERTPHLDVDARGVLFGITPRHTRAHVVRAVMEGVAYGLRDSLEILGMMNVPIREIRLTGGGGKSAVWRQIVADVFGLPISRLNVEEGPAFGAALLAGVGAGVFPDLRSATDRMLKVVEVTQPNATGASTHGKNYPRFQRLYQALREEFKHTRL